MSFLTDCRTLEECEVLCRSHIGRIEVLGTQNEVEIVYFPIPQVNSTETFFSYGIQDFRPSSQRTHPTFLQNLVLQILSVDLQEKQDLNAQLEKTLTENLESS